MRARLLERLNAPRDIASLAALRVLFGLVMAGSVVRYFANGWVERYFVEPRFHFHYLGFSWVEPLSRDGMIAVYAVLLVAALCIAAGLFYRVSTVVFFVGFNYVHLIDVTYYLNHYYLVSLLSLLLCVLPLHRAWSLDAHLRPGLRVDALPAWMLYLVRFQVAIVYLGAALAKVGPDWLLYGQPLNIWLHARTDTPIIGGLLDQPWVAIAMSWAGFLYDATIVFWLSWRRSRPFAFAMVCGFHFMTSVFFAIGIFPVVMTVAATMFFDPSWPRRLRRRAPGADDRDPARASASAPFGRVGRAGLVALGLYCILHVSLPLRTHLYGGDVLWHEQGMRWSWRVMVREKNGDVGYRVRVDGEDRVRRVSPDRYLNLHQAREFSGQPDLILQLAHRIRDDFRAEGHEQVEVRADAWVSLNGRPSARLIDPDVDLARVDDGVRRATWILAAPAGPPAQLRAYRAPVALAERSR